MKRVFLRSKIICSVLYALFFFNGIALGQSTVYLCYTYPPNQGGVMDISFNGEEVFKMYRKTKKICHFNSEGNLME